MYGEFFNLPVSMLYTFNMNWKIIWLRAGEGLSGKFKNTSLDTNKCIGCLHCTLFIRNVTQIASLFQSNISYRLR